MGSLAKDSRSASASASYSAVVDSDTPIDDVSLTFSGVGLAQNDVCSSIPPFSCSDSSVQIGASATFNGVKVPITFTTDKLAGNPLKVGGKSKAVDVQLIDGAGKAEIPPSLRGVLSISPVALTTGKDFGFLGAGPDVFAGIALTNWTATVSVKAPEPSSVLLLSSSLVALGGLAWTRRCRSGC